MPTHPDMTTAHPHDETSDASVQASMPPTAGGPDPGDQDRTGPAADLLDAMQHQVALFARRAEQTRLGGVGQARNSMDRAAYLLLNRLDQDGPTGVKALAAGMGIDSSTVTRQVAPLVESGLVKRTSHPDDGRAVVLQLSPRGVSRLEQVRASRRELMALLTREWSEEEQTVFCDLLTRFNQALSDLQASGS
ncbi:MULTISPECIES: MarR family winged helix-turn-helix transcriptional regulator [Streptomyces]|uniref:MarR family winged helix-turn-helix transcriptional regulator n=1 Tax=Streptomyces desertarenae TaxID=2666184 RepID=A0ABW4PIK3_9ACTN